MIYILPYFTPPDRHSDVYRNFSDRKFNELKNIILWKKFIYSIGGLEELLNDNNIFLYHNLDLCQKDVLNKLRNRIYYWS